MPVATISTNRAEPVLNYGFAVSWSNSVKGYFTECSGLGLEREVKDQPEGGVNDHVHQLPGRVKQQRITLKHGLAGNELWDWFQKGLYDGQVERRNISIVLFTSDLKVHKWWDLKDAYPIKWSGPSLNSSSNEIGVETLELVHHGLSVGQSGQG